MASLDEWGLTIPVLGENPNIPNDLETMRGGFRGYFPAYFATKLARNSATTTFLARPGNAGKTGMQAYVGELRANTVYLPTVGWRFVSPILEENIVERNYGTGFPTNPSSSEVDPFGIDLTNQIVGTKVIVDTQIVAWHEHYTTSPQTVAFTFDRVGCTRDTLDPASWPLRIMGWNDGDKYLRYTDLARFSVTAPTVSLRLRMYVGSGVGRVVLMTATHRITVAHGASAA